MSARARVGVGSDHVDDTRPNEPGRLVPEARRALRGLDGADTAQAAARLAEASRVLPQFVEEARYPLWAEREEQAGYYRDPAEELVSLVNDEDVFALAPASRWTSTVCCAKPAATGDDGSCYQRARRSCQVASVKSAIVIAA